MFGGEHGVRDPGSAFCPGMAPPNMQGGAVYIRIRVLKEGEKGR
jgi:hypothetical protein